MKKLITFAINFCLIVSLLIPMSTVQGMGEQLVNITQGQDNIVSGLFRTRVQVEQIYDLTRLQKMEIQILEQGETWAVVLVTETQLESLARLGFEPEASEDLAVLVAANKQSSPWLASSLNPALNRLLL